ncbi:pilus assembly protein [Streptomyces huiliensis]|uniref:pilus assembly protein n=1 Tax=Streptomyces huiliensis TaxID=2876027 RepID=UPI0027E0DF9A|nr:pilus assembly protein [Streptomyces huiliensis]
MGFLPILLLVGLAAIQLGLAAFAAQQAGTGARAAARTATLDDPRAAPEAAARAAMTDWVARRADTVQAPPCTPGAEVTATVDVAVPGLLPGTGFHVTRHATMRCPDDTRAPVDEPRAPADVPRASAQTTFRATVEASRASFDVPHVPVGILRGPSDVSPKPHEPRVPPQESRP